MKIMVVSQYYYPEQFRVNDICEQFVKDGHDVTVLTGLPNYPSGNTQKEYKRFKKRKEVYKGVNIIRTFEIARKKGTIRLGLNYISFMISSSLKAIRFKWDFDIIFVYQLSPISIVVPALILKKKSKKPMFIYSCDIWPESVKNIIKSDKSIIFRLIDKFSKYLYNKADAIGVTSKPFVDYFNKHHLIPLKNIYYIPQHAESNYLTIKKTVENGVFDFVFLGNIGIAQDIETIINAVSILKSKSNYHIHFVGDGSKLLDIKQKVIDLDLSSLITFHGRFPLENMLDFYNLADACLLTLEGDTLIGQTMPSKLQGYMAAGRMVVAAINGSSQEIITESNCGKIVHSGDSYGLSIIMKEAIEEGSSELYGENGRKYFKEHFILDRYMEKVYQVINKLMEENNNV